MSLSKLAAIFFFLICSLQKIYAQIDYRNTTIYLVRHAEKDTGNNPTLTEGGRHRAGDLMRYLKKAKINHIYSTAYKRTEMTGDSLRVNRAIEMVNYPPKANWMELTELLKKNNDLGKTVLFIGHSNTIPLLIKTFGIADFPQADLPDNSFDDIFIIRYKKGKAVVKRKKYGQPSDKSAVMLK
ncbi:MAG: histidine phosphatase family protein [Ferruginibacter sp.]